ncbi:MAG TPA: hypothetical protein VL563_00045, partial [Gemmatimonadales bacterium]|nr:hypothetical protein [Gemmatimonadales bacterium]
EQSLEDRAREHEMLRALNIPCPASKFVGRRHDNDCDTAERLLREATERATQALRADVDAASKRLCRREGETLLAAVEALSAARGQADAERAKLATEAEAARGEVERLRDDVLHARLLAAQRDDKLKAAHAEADGLRERLAVGERLLRAAAPFIGWSSKPDGLVDRIYAFLDTPAAPVTPAEPTDHELEARAQAGEFDHDGADCEGEFVAVTPKGEPRACGEPCMFCRLPVQGTCARPAGHPDLYDGDKDGKICACAAHPRSPEAAPSEPQSEAPPALAADVEECELRSRVDTDGTRQVTARCLKTNKDSGGPASDIPRCNETEAKGGWAKFPGETADQRALRYLDENCTEHKHCVRSASAAPTEEPPRDPAYDSLCVGEGREASLAVARWLARKATGKVLDQMSDWGQDRYIEEARALLRRPTPPPASSPGPLKLNESGSVTVAPPPGMTVGSSPGSEAPFDAWDAEQDDSLTPLHMAKVWRIVARSDRERYRRLGTTARPPYIATVYDLGHAQEIVNAHNDRHDRDAAVSRARAEGRVEALKEAEALCRELDAQHRRLTSAYAIAADRIARLSATTEMPTTIGGEK